jgi:hypothetical protein
MKNTGIPGRLLGLGLLALVTGGAAAHELPARDPEEMPGLTLDEEWALAPGEPQNWGECLDAVTTHGHECCGDALDAWIGRCHQAWGPPDLPVDIEAEEACIAEASRTFDHCLAHSREILAVLDGASGFGLDEHSTPNAWSALVRPEEGAPPGSGSGKLTFSVRVPQGAEGQWRLHILNGDPDSAALPFRSRLAATIYVDGLPLDGPPMVSARTHEVSYALPLATGSHRVTFFVRQDDYSHYGFLVAWMERDERGAARAGAPGSRGGRPTWRAKTERGALH